MLLHRKADGSERAGWYRTALGVLRAVLVASLLIACTPRGIAQDIEVHHTIKTEWPCRGAAKERVEDESFSFSPDGKTLAFLHRYAGLVLWNLEKGKPRMAAGAWKVVGWDADTGKERIVASFTEGDKRALVWLVDGMAFSPDSKTLAYSTMEGIRFLDVATCREKGILVARGYSPKMLAFMPDGKTLAWNGWKSMGFWDIRRDRLRLEIPHAQELWYGRTLSFTQDGKVGVSLPTDSSIDVWKIETGERQATLKPEVGYCSSAIISPDGNSIAAVVGSGHGNVDLWDVATRKVTHLPIEDACQIRIERMAFTPDSRTLAVLDEHRRIALWEVATATIRAGLPGQTHTPDMQFSPDGRFLAAGAKGSIKFWDLAGVKRKPPDATETGRLWTVLARAGAESAYQAIRTLTAFPTQALPVLRNELRSQILSEAECKIIDRLLVDLDGDAFAVREKASKELKQLGLRAESRLRRALEEQPTPEVRRRLKALVEVIERQKASEPIQYLRAVEVLEHIGTPEAAAMLEDLAQRGCNPRLTQDAKASLARLKKRPIPKP